MTLYLNNTDTTYDFFANGQLDTAAVLQIKSQWDHSILVEVDLDIIESNERYTHFEFTLGAPLGDQHKSGIYTYVVYDDLSTALISGIVKVITEPGGTAGTESYISNNENRDGITYFRPTY